MNALLNGESDSLRGAEAPFGFEVAGHSALYRDNYKLVRTPAPLGDGSWRLYDIVNDPGETTDLAAQMPDLAAAMLADYEAYESRVGVLALPPGYDVQRQVIHNVRMKQLERNWWVLALGALAALALMAGLIWLSLRLFRRGPT